MGIDSLLKVLKSVTKKRHISEYKDKRVAIDTYCWYLFSLKKKAS